MNLLFEIGCYLIGGGLLAMFVGSLAKMNWNAPSSSDDWFFILLPVGFVSCVAGVGCFVVRIISLLAHAILK